MRSLLLYAMLFSLFTACKSSEERPEAVLDPSLHSYANPDKIVTTHLDWKAEVDFTQKQIRGTASWTFKHLAGAPFLQFDTYALTIKKVWVNGRETSFYVGPFDKDYGSSLSIPVKPTDTIVAIEYHTGPIATALQWLTPEQTAGKKLPYLFTQCESIHARSLLPCQDMPSNRITYHADVQVPAGMMAIMSARNPTERNPQGKYSFDMELPIPTYLIALAVGDISYKAIDKRSGVYTEPSQLDAAAAELSDIPAMMQAAEKLVGPYRWGRYDVLIAPPSFPIGGMENPRLTFATPTIIAGDKSLVSLIAHEMAHSWSGNLVTNATWNDIWLNEGFTTYVERRIMESISGTTYNDMLWELGYQDMQSDLQLFGSKSPDTRLRVDLTGRDPGEGFSNIPYEKGAVFLRMLEEGVGRARFDTFMNAYFSSHAFTTMTTKKCLAYMDEHLFRGDIELRKQLRVDEWVYQPGLPENCPHKQPERFIAVDRERVKFEQGEKAAQLSTGAWTTHEWLQFLRKLPRPLPHEQLKDLDQQFTLSGIKNSEIADEWYRLCIASAYAEAYPAMEHFLRRVGRKKFLEPLYSELMKTPEGRERAKTIFAGCRRNYHPLTALKIEQILGLNKKEG